MNDHPYKQKRLTLFLANVHEWVAGLVAFLLISLFFKEIAHAMPVMLLGAGVVVWGLALTRIKKIENRTIIDALESECEYLKQLPQLIKQEKSQMTRGRKLFGIVIALLYLGAYIFVAE